MAEPDSTTELGPNVASMGDAELLRYAAEETHDTGEGCSCTVAVELERRGLVTYQADDENEESAGTLTAKGRAALGEEGLAP